MAYRTIRCTGVTVWSRMIETTDSTLAVATAAQSLPEAPPLPLAPLTPLSEDMRAGYCRAGKVLRIASGLVRAAVVTSA
jgi:hypothetical protein